MVVEAGKYTTKSVFASGTGREPASIADAMSSLIWAWSSSIVVLLTVSGSS